MARAEIFRSAWSSRVIILSLSLVLQGKLGGMIQRSHALTMLALELFLEKTSKLNLSLH